MVSIGSYRSLSSPLLCGVPQGSVLGPMLFTLYTSPIEEIVTSHGFDLMLYADDSQIYIVCERPDEVLPSISSCIDELSTWLSANSLVFNESKTEAVHFISRLSKDHNDLEILQVGKSVITLKSKVKNLGVIFENRCDMTADINRRCKSAFYGLKRISKLSHLLNQSQTEKLIHAFVTSHLDYGNSLLYGLPQYLIDKLQSVQNAAARLISKTQSQSHITPILKYLHWLPICKRIEFKILLLTFKHIRGESPHYFNTMIQGNFNVSTRPTRHNTLCLPRRDTRHTLKTYGHRSFTIAAPILWNRLPYFIKSQPDIEHFKKELKTFL